jgi:hypothetical protein
MFLFWLRTPPRIGRRVNRPASCGGIAFGLDEMPLVRGDGLRGDVDQVSVEHAASPLPCCRVIRPQEPTAALKASLAKPSSNRQFRGILDQYIDKRYSFFGDCRRQMLPTGPWSGRSGGCRRRAGQRTEPRPGPARRRGPGVGHCRWLGRPPALSRPQGCFKRSLIGRLLCSKPWRPGSPGYKVTTSAVTRAGGAPDRLSLSLPLEGPCSSEDGLCARPSSPAQRSG